MKKFLFTLAAMLMAGSLFAQDNYLYVPDMELTQEEATNGVQNKPIFVVAHFESYVTTVDFQVQLPEGMTVVSSSMPNAAKPYVYQYVDVEDDEGNITSELTRQRMNPQVFGAYPHWIITTSLGAETDNCYNEDGSICYGAPKWGVDPVEFNFLRLVVNIEPGFNGGDVLVHTEPASTPDPRGNVCPKGTEYDKVNVITVQGGGEPVVTDAPEIVVTAGDDAYVFDVVGPEGAELKLFVDGVEVEIPYTVARTDVDQIVKLTATSHIEGQTDGTVTGEYLVPALPVVEPEDLTGEIVIGDPDENGNVTINYTGDENVTIVVTVNGEVVEVVDGVITVGEGESEIIVTVTAEGYNDLTDGKTVTYTVPVEPQPTATPEISYVVTDNEVIITVTGEGEIHVYVDGVEVDNPATIVRGEEDQTVVVTATAQAEGQLISETATEEIVIPAYVDDPEGHMTGYWIVLIDENDGERWYQMIPDPNNEPNWSIMMTLHHYPWKENVPFYFMINGVRYGSEVDMQLPGMGSVDQTILNPVYEGENMFYVPATYTYTFGLQLKDGQYYLLVAQGPQTAINEMNADKTVAAVRYFNMAGQEMQEANGMTIVVTTYTDGTTSAVKVMK